MHILVTGGTGYIGSHTCVALLAAHHQVTILDNLSNSDSSVVERIKELAGVSPTVFEGDVRDRALLRRIFSTCPVDAVIHFAGLKAVGESVAWPLRYYDCNVGGTTALLAAMEEADVRVLVFSSSATVYGDPASVPIREDFPRATTNPYGASKLMIEDMLADMAAANPDWRIARLRYFNPVGAHESALLGESPTGIPNNLMPYVAQVAAGVREKLSVFGGDWPTPDGTGVRDYIHVVDLADGHMAALNYLAQHAGMLTVNLGTGRGTSVLEMVRAFSAACGRELPFAIVGRRPGDIAECWADPAAAQHLLGWRAQRDIDAMCRDAWRWQQRQPALTKK
ncbi:UDP-glucose 4-epimerase GalE [Rhodocyclus gracilis]|uniref:UDP-glucose 4-epimerase n=1 Tax=Rhodocyclus tenuis TaxID=1066 RepID=A0A6L5K092_RHOTE|nr:UDP-glucose 4-epimerase GalE [Rhodocyclus gracilis]MQY52250.1 UDP-glucose 4-epimerase GalE [Rhodocyclus gracilis]